jgi:3-phenylpropionate/trans-cinnamate dioxygenase ferredoxin subunit
MAPTLLPVCRAAELGAAGRRVVERDGIEILVVSCGGQLFAIENRCSHEDAPLAEGELDEQGCSIECPRHGSRFDLRTGRALSLPAYLPVEVFGVGPRTA